MPLILMLLFFPCLVQSQIVTASFDPSVISYNPAAAGQRFFGGAFVRFDKKSMTANGTETGDIPDQDLSNLNVGWEVTDEITSTKVLLAGKKSFLVPEIFYAKQYLTTNWHRTDNSGGDAASSSKKSADIGTTHLNLAINPFKYLSLGFHYAQTTMEEESDINFTINGGRVGEAILAEIDFSGQGAGATIQLPFGFYIGGSYTEYNLDITGSGTAFFNGGSRAITTAGEESFRVRTYGLAFFKGKRKGKSFKIEISEKLNSSNIARFVEGRRRSLSIEGMTKNLYGGFAIMLTRGDFVDFQDIVQAIINERVNSNQDQIGFSGSAGLKSSKGHSIGLSGSYSDQDIKSQLSYYNEENQFNTNLKVITFSASYAYLF